MRYEQTFTMFTPAEAERITGVSVDLQRNWRRRGYLSKHDGHARFDIVELAEMLTLRLLSEAGLGLEAAKEWTPVLPATIIKFALYVDGAIEGDGDQYKSRQIFFAESIASKVSKLFTGEVLIVWANGESETVRDAEEAQVKAPPEKLFGVVRIIDLQILGEELARRAGRALVHIEATE